MKHLLQLLLLLTGLVLATVSNIAKAQAPSSKKPESPWSSTRSGGTTRLPQITIQWHSERASDVACVLSWAEWRGSGSIVYQDGRKMKCV